MTNREISHKASMLERRLRKAFKGIELVKVIRVGVHASGIDSTTVIRMHVEFDGGGALGPWGGVESEFGPAIGAYDLARDAKREIQIVLDAMVADYLAAHPVEPKTKLEEKREKIAARTEKRRVEGQIVVDGIIEKLADQLPPEFSVTARLRDNGKQRDAVVYVCHDGRVVIEQAGYLFINGTTGLADRLVESVLATFDAKLKAVSFPPVNGSLGVPDGLVQGRL